MENKNIYVVVTTVHNDGESYVESYRDRNSAVRSIIDDMLGYDEIDKSSVNNVQHMLDEHMYYKSDDNEIVYEIFETTLI